MAPVYLPLVHTGRNRFLERIERSGQRFVAIFAKGREFREIRASDQEVPLSSGSKWIEYESITLAPDLS